MLPDRVSNPGPLTYESGALPIALRGPARYVFEDKLTKYQSISLVVSFSARGICNCESLLQSGARRDYTCILLPQSSVTALVPIPLNSLTTKKQTTKFSKSFKSKLYHIENSKTRGQTV